MEISWRHGLNDFSMPFMINLLSEQMSAIQMLKQDNEERKARESSQQKQQEDTPILGPSRLMLTQGPPPAPSPFGGPASNGLTPNQTGLF